MTRADLAALMRSARMHNLNRHITGLLLHRDGHFLQYLEGPEPAVHELFGRIAADPRHTEVTRLFDGPAPERLFSAWSLAFQELDASKGPAAQAGFQRTDSLNSLVEHALTHAPAPPPADEPFRRLWSEIAPTLPR